MQYFQNETHKSNIINFIVDLVKLFWILEYKSFIVE